MRAHIEFPACRTCRQRKIRCNIDRSSERCQFCRKRDLPCEIADSTHDDPEARFPKRRRTENVNISATGAFHYGINSRDRSLHSSGQDQVRRSEYGLFDSISGPAEARGAAGQSDVPPSRSAWPGNLTQQPVPRVLPTRTSTDGSAEALAQFTSPEESASMLMNPPMAEDLQVLDQYLTSSTTDAHTSSEPYRRVSSSSTDDSIVYLSLPRQRKGLQATVDPGRAQREILEQILGKQKDDVLNLYFQKVHPCLPIIDEASFWYMWRCDRARISSPLLCQMYATSLVFWQCSEPLRRYGQPDMAFAWNNAVTALRDDLLAPCMTTVHASLLAITGRPTIGVTGNVVKAGSMITLAHSLALHRDPSSWQTSDAEKHIRTVVWWAVVIHDYWSSIAHGTPPNIRRENCDVPLPESDSSTITFRYLCSISAILGDVLPLVYALRLDSREAEKSVRRLECDVDVWVDGLPSPLKPPNSGTDGACNLWFCYLSVRLLLCRVAYKTATRNASGLPEEKHYRLAALRDAAIQVSEYVTALTDQNLLEFWLPYTAYLLVSTATTLLRTAIESPHEAKVQCVQTLLALSARLMAARESLSWDIGDFCLQRCKPTIDKLASALGLVDAGDTEPSQQVGVQTQANPSMEDPTLSLEADLLLPLDSLDYQFNLFDGFAGPWAAANM